MKSKKFMYLTEFFAGMGIMAVELGASRLLAPYFSSSQIVWTIIIAVIMIAMALGNVIGGRSADKNPDPAKLYKRLLIAGVWIAAIPVLGKYVVIAISGLLVITVSHNLLIIAALLSCLIIFVYPCFLLGTVTPSLVKYTVEKLDNNGSIVGKLGAANTIGSIIGTFLPTFITIPAVGTSITFLIFSGMLIVLALIYFIFIKKNIIGCVIAAILYIICIILGNKDSFAFWEKSLAYEGESIYNYLQVKDDDYSTILSTNVLFGVQSITIKDGSLTGMYYDYAMAAPVLANQLDNSSDNKNYEDMDVLVLGMGTGTFARQCKNYLGDMNIEGVEIDSKITDLAHEYFRLSKDIPVTTYDGRAFLNVNDKKYDVIMVDAYQDITIPFQMSSSEFFNLVKSHLKDNGVMVVNINMRIGGAGSINEYLSDTIASVFDNVYSYDCQGSTNKEIFASDKDISSVVLKDGINNVKNKKLANLLTKLANNYDYYEGGDHIFTDDKAPVELLGMEAVDEIIKEEIGYYKDIVDKEGIGGLLK